MKPAFISALRHVVKDGPDWTGLAWTGPDWTGPGKRGLSPCFTNRELRICKTRAL